MSLPWNLVTCENVLISELTLPSMDENLSPFNAVQGFQSRFDNNTFSMSHIIWFRKRLGVRIR